MGEKGIEALAPRGVDRFIASVDAPALRARIWRDITGRALKAGAVALGVIVLAAGVWHLTR